MTELQAYVETLLKKAAEAETNGALPGPHAAMQYSQAALNAANAICALITAKNLQTK